MSEGVAKLRGYAGEWFLKNHLLQAKPSIASQR